MPQYELPYVKKPMLKKTASGSAADEAGMDGANKILTFGTTPSYRCVHFLLFFTGSSSKRGVPTFQSDFPVAGTSTGCYSDQ